MNLRSWLRRQPQPARLRCDGQHVMVGTGPTRWKDALAAIEAIDPQRVEALDGAGVVLRACSLREDGDVDGASQDETSGRTEVVQLATLISEAHDRGAARHEAAYHKAFEQLTGLVGLIANRLGVMETAWQKAMVAQANAHARLIEAQAEANDQDPMAQVMGMLAPQVIEGGKSQAEKKAKGT